MDEERKLLPWTPGPWLIHAVNRWVVPAEDAFKEPADALPICQLRAPDERLTEDETLANGFLIAAAPELYGRVQSSSIALEEAAKLLEGHSLFGCASIMRGYISGNNAALAKARGDKSEATNV